MTSSSAFSAASSASSSSSLTRKTALLQVWCDTPVFDLLKHVPAIVQRIQHHHVLVSGHFAMDMKVQNPSSSTAAAADGTTTTTTSPQPPLVTHHTQSTRWFTKLHFMLESAARALDPALVPVATSQPFSNNTPAQSSSHAKAHAASLAGVPSARAMWLALVLLRASLPHVSHEMLTKYLTQWLKVFVYVAKLPHDTRNGLVALECACAMLVRANVWPDTRRTVLANNLAKFTPILLDFPATSLPTASAVARYVRLLELLTSTFTTSLRAHAPAIETACMRLALAPSAHVAHAHVVSNALSSLLAALSIADTITAQRQQQQAALQRISTDVTAPSDSSQPKYDDPLQQAAMTAAASFTTHVVGKSTTSSHVWLHFVTRLIRAMHAIVAELASCLTQTRAAGSSSSHAQQQQQKQQQQQQQKQKQRQVEAPGELPWDSLDAITETDTLARSTALAARYRQLGVVLLACVSGTSVAQFTSAFANEHSLPLPVPALFPLFESALRLDIPIALLGIITTARTTPLASMLALPVVYDTTLSVLHACVSLAGTRWLPFVSRLFAWLLHVFQRVRFDADTGMYPNVALAVRTHATLAHLFDQFGPAALFATGASGSSSSSSGGSAAGDASKSSSVLQFGMATASSASRLAAGSTTSHGAIQSVLHALLQDAQRPLRSRQVRQQAIMHSARLAGGGSLSSSSAASRKRARKNAEGGAGGDGGGGGAGTGGAGTTALAASNEAHLASLHDTSDLHDLDRVAVAALGSLRALFAASGAFLLPAQRMAIDRVLVSLLLCTVSPAGAPLWSVPAAYRASLYECVLASLLAPVCSLSANSASPLLAFALPLFRIGAMDHAIEVASACRRGIEVAGSLVHARPAAASTANAEQLTFSALSATSARADVAQGGGGGLNSALSSYAVSHVAASVLRVIGGASADGAAKVSSVSVPTAVSSSAAPVRVQASSASSASSNVSTAPSYPPATAAAVAKAVAKVEAAAAKAAADALKASRRERVAPSAAASSSLSIASEGRVKRRRVEPSQPQGDEGDEGDEGDDGDDGSNGEGDDVETGDRREGGEHVDDARVDEAEGQPVDSAVDDVPHVADAVATNDREASESSASADAIETVASASAEESGGRQDVDVEVETATSTHPLDPSRTIEALLHDVDMAIAEVADPAQSAGGGSSINGEDSARVSSIDAHPQAIELAAASANVTDHEQVDLGAFDDADDRDLVDDDALFVDAEPDEGDVGPAFL